MGQRSAGGIYVQVGLGAEQFLGGMRLCNGELVRFAQTAGTSMGGARLAMVSASSSVRMLEGNFGGANRALARFLVDSAKLGPILEAAFPIVGIVAFGAAAVKIFNEIKKHLDEFAEAGNKMKSTMLSLAEPVILTSDELQKSVITLQNQIERLQGKRENILAEMLIDAKIAADKLGESIENVLDKINKVVKDSAIGQLENFFTGESATVNGTNVSDALKKLFQGERGHGGLGLEYQELRMQGENDVAKARATGSLEQTNRARAAYEARTQEFIAKATKAVDDIAKNAITFNMRVVPSPTGLTSGVTLEPTNVKSGLTDADKEEIRGLKVLLAQLAGIPSLSGQQAMAQQTLAKLGGDRANQKLETPYDNRIRELQAQLSGAQTRLGAAGGSDQAKLLAEAYSKYADALAQVTKTRDGLNFAISAGQKLELAQLIRMNLLTEAEAKYRDEMAKSSEQTQARVTGLNAIISAIGTSYEKVSSAQAYAQTISQMGDRFTHPDSHAAQEFAVKYAQNLLVINKENEKTIGETVKGLKEQVAIEEALVRTAGAGSASQRRAEFEAKIANLRAQGGPGIDKQIEQETKLFNLKEQRVQSEDLTKLQAENAVLLATNQALTQGADAERKAADAAKLATAAHNGASAAVLAEMKANQELTLQNERLSKALKPGLEMFDKQAELRQSLQILEANKGSLSVMIAQREAYVQLLEVQSKIALQQDSIKAGIFAFFAQMEAQAKTVAQLISESLGQVVSRFSEQLTKVMTAEKGASWGKMFEDTGRGILHSTLQTGLEKGLGAIGKHFGVVGKPDGSQGNPLWVRITDGGGGGGGGSSAPGIASPLFSAVLSAVLKGVSHRAGGGDVSPGSAYAVGEFGPELFIPHTSGSIMSNQLSSRAIGGGGSTYFLSIDARGTDPELTAQRTSQAILAAHHSAVGSAQRAQVQRTWRVPQGR